MPVSKRSLDTLRSYLEGAGPNDQGEWGMRCPLHNDSKRSASMNVNSGLWFCQACDVGGQVTKLVKRIIDGDVDDGASKAKQGSSQSQQKAQFPYGDDQVRAWCAALHADTGILEKFCNRRSLTVESLVEYEIGWDAGRNAYTIPVRDSHGELINIRWYQLDPSDERRKIWSVAGHGEPSLYPIDNLTETEEVIFCEGELDAIATWQRGFNTVTRTGGAKSWRGDWARQFAGMTVYVCQDSDKDGQAGVHKVVAALRKVAKACYAITLPYPITDKHGKDLTDFWIDGHSPEDLRQLMDAAKLGSPAAEESSGMVDVKVIDTFDSRRSGERMRMRVTVTGKRNPPYMVPKCVEFTCTMDAGPKCKVCPMMDMDGYYKRKLANNDPISLSMLDVSFDTMNEVLRKDSDIQKCNCLHIDIQEFQTVEELFVRPSVDIQLTSQEAGDYTNRRIFGVGNHDTLPNTTVELVGTTHPNPKNQKNEFLAWSSDKVETNIDKFVLDKDMIESLKVFRTSADEGPLRKLESISEDMAANVTKIYGRTQLHMFMDVIFHSVLSFEFMGQNVHRGWLDGLVVGDTRTGKSEAADKLRMHYGMGEMLSCESASFAGIVGGLSQLSDNAWEISWGAIPLNDRRMVIMDEISGMTPENIAQMSSIRSSGEAQLTKIRSEKTFARTRLLWLGNPRNARMTDFTYGVQAIKPLIGNNEDVARFDLAMAVQSGEVESEHINSSTHQKIEHVYNSDISHNLLLWAWSRSMDQVEWASGAEQNVLDLAIRLGKEYAAEDPPLIQAANVRIKLARVSVAIAARLFSSDNEGEKLIVRKSHVKAAYDFINSLYRQGHFGYSEVSREMLVDQEIAQSFSEEMRLYMAAQPLLAKFLRVAQHFRRGDLEDILNLSREEATGIMNLLWERRMIRRDGPNSKCMPVLHDILREMAP